MPNSRPRLERRPSFILVGKDEEEEISWFNVLGNMGMPILYILAGACVLIGAICMGIITKYWASLNPPQCFLYSQSASSQIFFHFGTNLSSCYFVAYGGIPVVIIIAVCGVLYIFHVKDDKRMDMWSVVCIGAMFVATTLSLIVSCTLTQGFRITCATLSFNLSNNKGYSCKEKLDRRVDQFNLPVQTSTMITASMATMWIGTTCLILISIFHIALYVRRSSLRQY